MVKNQVKVKSYKQRRNGKVYIVKGYKRSKRPLGKKIKYEPVGEFYVAHDDQGNFRGSKVVLKRKAKKTTKKPAKKAVNNKKPVVKKKVTKKNTAKKRVRYTNAELEQLNKDYISGKITMDEWFNKTPLKKSK